MATSAFNFLAQVVYMLILFVPLHSEVLLVNSAYGIVLNA